jgi:hypothetical protein
VYSILFYSTEGEKTGTKLQYIGFDLKNVDEKIGALKKGERQEETK